MPFDYQQAVKMRQQRREQVSRWKQVSTFDDDELRWNNLKNLDRREALEDALDEMDKEEVALLIRMLMVALKNEASK